METRILEQVKIYTLHLNPMPDNFEKTNMVAIAFNKEELQAWYDGLKVDPYKDGNWHKVFQQGSPLEWYNPIEWSRYSGIKEEWTTIADVHQYIKSAQQSLGFTEVPEIINSQELIPA